MNDTTETADALNTIIPTVVPRGARLNFLPKHFGSGSLMLVVENRVYDIMREQADTYHGGWWEYLDLSNGGMYMRPPAGPRPGGKWLVSVPGNGYHGELSADAAGIVVCLAALSHLSFEYPQQVLAERFHQLRDFAGEHPEAAEIFAAID